MLVDVIQCMQQKPTIYPADSAMEGWSRQDGVVVARRAAFICADAAIPKAALDCGPATTPPDQPPHDPLRPDS